MAPPQTWNEDRRFREAKELPFLVIAGESVWSTTEEKNGVLRDVPESTRPTEVEAVALRELFAKTFPQDPDGTVGHLRQ
jgi:hypothetical protein